MTTTKLTTLQLEIALMEYFGITRNLIVPCITDMSGLSLFEVDLLVLSKANFATGIEIKVSKTDLRKDLTKRHIKYLEENPKSKDHYFGQFKKFYYAVPDFLATDALQQIPPFCGLLVVSYDEQFGYQVQEIRQSEKLSNFKWSEQMAFNLARLGAMRILKYKRGIQSYKNQFSDKYKAM